VAVGNLEGAVADKGELNDLKRSRLAAGATNIFAFMMPTRYAAYLRDAGYDFVSMANNHSYDFGMNGQNSSRKALDEVGVGYAGNPGHEMMVKEIDGVRYGYCAFGYNRLTILMRNESEVKRIITELRSKADVVIVSFHGGGEGAEFRHVPQGAETQYGENRGELRHFAHFCIDNGADVVYGHGPHVVRGVELYKDNFIAYSLGNFATPTGISVAGITGYAPVITVNIDREGKFISGKIHSFIQQVKIGPRVDRNNIVAREIKSLSEADFPQSKLVISATGEMTK
ncbi:MAG: CapA family protein, partial [Muribaculaceae bacterium]|nr:CapA family protein [Muribaculaceae bacterium]